MELADWRAGADAPCKAGNGGAMSNAMRFSPNLKCLALVHNQACFYKIVYTSYDDHEGEF